MLEISTMTRREVSWAIGLAAAEGWNPGRADAELFHRADPRGFFIARLDDEPVGCVSAVSYPGGFGFLGLFIVVPGRRGQGIGGALWGEAMRYLDGHAIGLDGVVAQQQAYARAGFALRHRNIRYRLTQLPQSPSSSLTPAASLPIADLASYDRQCFQAPREKFLEGWVTASDATALALLGDGRVRGYGVARACREGYKVGPLFADDAGIARQLFVGLCDRVDAPVFLDVPECNRGAVDLAESFGMEVVFETARMYRGEPPPVREERVYGITTFELG